MILSKKRTEVVPVEDLNIDLLVERFNRATVGFPHKRQKKDRDRHYVGLKYPPRSSDWQGRLAADMLRFFKHRKMPPAINLDRLGWEVLTALGQSNKKAALELITFLINRQHQFAELLNWYQFYATARPDYINEQLKQLIKERLSALAGSDEDRRLLDELE